MKRSSEKKETSPNQAEAHGARWYRLVHQSTDPVFVLNHRRRVLFVNSAWERLTQFSLELVRGWSCKAITSAKPDRKESLLAALAPPPDVLSGRPATVRRRWPVGACDIWEVSFLPFCGNGDLRGIVGRIVLLPTADRGDRPPLPAKLSALADRLRQWHSLDLLGGDFPPTARLAEQIRLASASLQPACVVGEPGAGKRWVARTVHERGPARDRCFAAIDCRYVAPRIIADLLFSPHGPATTGIAGTIYLADAERIPRDLQTRICQWWAGARDGGADPKNVTRLIVGVSGDWNAAQRLDKFADEFRCLFTILTIAVPPLRERKSEFQAIAERLLQRIAGDQSAGAPALSPAALACLRAAPWPGNLAELAGALRQAHLRAETPEIQLADLPRYLRNSPPPEPPKLDLDAILKRVESRLIALALDRAKGNKSKAADMLTIWRGRLIRRLKEFEGENNYRD